MFRFFSLLTLALSLAFACQADQSDLPIIRNGQVGFGQQFHNRYWAPLRVDIENPGPARQAVLTVEPTSRAEGQSIVIAKPVFLPAKSRRSFWMSVLPEASENAPSAKSDLPDTKILKVFSVKLTDGGLKVWSQYDAIGKVIPEASAVVLVADARLTSYRVPADLAQGFARRNLVRITIKPDDLPAHAIDLDGISLLILGNQNAIELHSLQRHAITEWVNAGGTVLFAPGPNTTNDWLSTWQSLLPVYYRAGDRIATEPRLRQWAEPVVFDEGMHMQRTILRDGTTMAGDENSPLLAMRQAGLGYVAGFTLDAGDLAFQRWVGTTNFNTELISLALQVPPAADRTLEHYQGTDALVSSLAGIKVLGRGPILVYLAVLIGGMVGLLYAFRLTRTPERGWYALAGLAVLAGSGAIVAANRWKGSPQPFLNEIDIVNVGHNGTNAVTHSALALYSPQEAKYSFTVAGSAQVRPRIGNGIAAEPFGFAVDEEIKIPALAVRAQDIRAMYGQAALPAGPYPQAQARLTATGLELTVNNPTTVAMSDCFFKFNRFVAPLGDLPAGATRTFKDLRPGEPGDDWHFSKQVVQNAGDELRSRIRRIFFPDPVYTLGRIRNTSFGFRSPPLLSTPSASVHGWSAQPLFPLQSADAALQRRAVGFWSMESTLACDGKKLTIPRGILSLKLKNLDARTLERAEGRFSGTRGSQLVAEFSLPADFPAIRVEEARAVVAFRSSAFRCRVEVLPPGVTDLSNPKRKPQPALSGGPVYDIAQPGQWYDPARRTLTLAVTIEPNDKSDLQGSAVNYWQIRELDLEIGGTVP